MAGFCCVTGCRSKRGQLGSSGQIIAFHGFQKAAWLQERNQIWLDFVRRTKPKRDTPWQPGNQSKICSEHFVGGWKSEDPRRPNYNPTVYGNGCKVVRDDIPLRTTTIPGPRSEGNEVECEMTCAICLREVDQKVEKCVVVDKLSKFSKNILKSRQEPGLKATLRSFDDLSLCCLCLPLVTAAIHQDENVKEAEHQVRTLQLSLIQELRKLQTVLKSYNDKMTGLKDNVIKGDSEKLKKIMKSCTGGWKKDPTIFMFRQEIVTTAQDLDKFVEKLQDKVSGEARQQNQHDLDSIDKQPNNSSPVSRTTHQIEDISTASTEIKPEVEEIQIKEENSSSLCTSNKTRAPETISLFRREIMENIDRKLEMLRKADKVSRQTDPKHCQMHDWLAIHPFLEYPLVYDKTSGDLTVWNVGIEIDDRKRKLTCGAASCQLKLDKKGRHNSIEEFMWAHIVAHHLQIFKCPQCPCQLGSLQQYRDHLRAHENKFICRVCHRPCYSEASLQCHLTTHKSSSENSPERLLCKRTVSCRQGQFSGVRRQRERRTITPKKRQADPDHSQKGEKKMRLSDSELDPKPSPPVRPPPQLVPCSSCKRRMFPGSLKTHELFCRKNRSKDPVQVVCDKCGKSFTKRCNYLVHVARHTEERPFLCSQCPGTFKVFRDLTIHIKTHSEERKFLCEKGCGWASRDSYNRRRHMKNCTGRRRKLSKSANAQVEPPSSLPVKLS